jgi:hypothetical protein
MHLQPQKIPVPATCFSHIHMDIVGPLLVAHGFNPSAYHGRPVIPLAGSFAVGRLADTSTAVGTETLFHGWVSQFGVPSVLTSDRGTQFTSSRRSAVCQILGFSHMQTNAYHLGLMGSLSTSSGSLKMPHVPGWMGPIGTNICHG